MRTAAGCLGNISLLTRSARVHAVQPQVVTLRGTRGFVQLASRIMMRESLMHGDGGEVIAVDGDAATVAWGSASAPGVGAMVRIADQSPLRPGPGWLGRILDPAGRPLDGRPPPQPGRYARPLQASPPPPGLRARLGPRISLGVRALDAFTTCREGQRLGLFAASGVGKSSLLSMLARAPGFDVTVVGLVGERGRELREFVEDDLGREGMARSVVICATSDASALERRNAALAATTVAESFRDEGRRVLLLIDSITRFALALRELGLAAGEPPATRGYPPSVFASLPRLLERAGPGPEGRPGSITAVLTVLVEGDDHDEPVADAVRGILDGHVVLDRRIGEGGRYPAVDVLRSLSRTVPSCLMPPERSLALQARALLATHAEVADLVRLGAYRPGSDPAVDDAVRLQPRIEAVLRQDKHEDSGGVEGAFAALAAALDG
ncbi:FliI/YscN family ATPase [Roseomonas sp. CCTCC AB2023176]|uniref:FliI/YscN family ATPase n=1 Tax=Roseomonas sp. CCTCC AB2023176 TaxID=3342640 RepID=UPI0035DC250D